jgi:hypothetical protein
MRLWWRGGAPGAVLLLAFFVPSAAAAARNVEIEVLSNRADLVSADEALVAVTLPKGASLSKITASLGSRNVTDAFAARENGRIEGLVTGLANGPNLLVVRLPDGSGARLTITNHPNGGPVFSGPQVKPWVCQGTAKDKQCNQPAFYELRYRNSNGQWVAYDPASPPPNVPTTTTDQGVTVPYIVRIETGYQDRDQYHIAVLYDPSKPWTAWSPQKQWNHKLLITHGQSCGIDHRSGEAPDVLNDAALSRGFAVMSTALDNAGHNCNIVTQAESLVMAKERIVEQYGEIRYTIGTGCSGGSLTQQQVANAYPGIYQGILPQCSFPDAWSTGQQLAAYSLIRRYVENPARWAPGVVWTPLEMAAIEGHPNHVNAIILDSLYWDSLGDPTNPCAGVEDAERYNPQTNPRGERCTLADYMINVMGPRPQDGFAGRPLDNVGVQFGLEALKQGQITPAQFIDLNVKIGGADIDANIIQNRVEADRPALANTYRSGGINEANNLDRVAIIDLRGPDDGAFHDAYRSFAVRARLDREHGTHGNHVIWQGPVPLVGETGYATRGLLAMDRWLAAVEKDGRRASLARKIIDNRPAEVVDQCTNGSGQQAVAGTDCPAIVRVYGTPATVAGESIATDTNKCRLKPMNRADYAVEFTDAEWSQLQTVFPTGVCDWTRPGVDQQDTIPWQTYQEADGSVIYGGRPLGPAPRSQPFGCLSRRSPIGPRNIGRVRLGLTRAKLRRLPGAGKTTPRSWRWCVSGSRGKVVAVFTPKGRVALVATTARRHGNRQLRPGSGMGRLRIAYPSRRALGSGLFRAGPGSPRLIGVRRGRVRFIAVATPNLIGNRAALRRYLRLAGL